MDCTIPTQSRPNKHGQSLTIEDVLDQMQGCYLGQVSEGFQDAAEDPIPDELRSQEEHSKLEALKLGSKELSIRSTLERATEEGQSVFLEAQSLATLREVKKPSPSSVLAFILDDTAHRKSGELLAEHTYHAEDVLLSRSTRKIIQPPKNKQVPLEDNACGKDDSSS